MKNLRNQIPATVIVMLAVAAVSSFTNVAQADEPSRWHLKGGIMLVDTSDPFSIDKPSGGEIHAGGNAALGIAAAIEYRWTDMVGFEAGNVLAQSPDVDDRTNGNNDEIGEGPVFLATQAGVNFHLVSTNNVDFYVGPRVAYLVFDDFDLDIDGEETEFEVDNEFAWGAAMGLSYRFGDSRWALLAEATYLDVDMTISEQGAANVATTSFDPLMVNLGVSYRF